MKFLVLLIILIGIASCSDEFRQEYETLKEFDKSNLRAKSWFPDCVGKDAFNFKSISGLDSLYAFSRFEYMEVGFYDSILSSSDYTKIDFSNLEKVIEKLSGAKPDWFIDLETNNKGKLIYRKNDRWYIIKDSEDKTIYSLLTN
ncbi:hypothetical protein SAMN05216474_0541 [Lishizhenia tianjinensis]|uniref:YbbD head domain-containing protein n=1 Tax=Lishizhenia tianjinensis TaxID=477690 RepID=A0A1I6XZ51_9FLAO|nr:hypothetical protein [Lishizhenia tianjinensis]SFT43373.1 hypothetical protein SAMN05216474_0541 [Lishizhenia tianjinensis]